MRDFRDAKAMAQTLRTSLDAIGFKITVSQSLELIAHAFGVADWNTLSAAIGAQPAPAPASTAASPATPDGAQTPGKPGLSGELQATLEQAFAYARTRKHEWITVEHLLLALADNAWASRVMKATGVNLDELRNKLTEYIDSHAKPQTTGAADNPRPTVGFQRSLQRAVAAVHKAGLPANSLGVLVAIFSETESHAVQLFNEQGVTRADMISYMSHGNPDEAHF